MKSHMYEGVSIPCQHQFGQMAVTSEEMTEVTSFTLNGWSLVPSRSLEKEHSKACANPWRTISLIDGLGYAFTRGLLLEP